MKKLWLEHQCGNKPAARRVFIVGLPEPTEEERRIMAANRAGRKPVVMDEDRLKAALQNAVGKLGGW